MPRPRSSAPRPASRSRARRAPRHVLERRGELVEHRHGGAPEHDERVARGQHERADGQRDAAAGQRVEERPNVTPPAGGQRRDQRRRPPPARRTSGREPSSRATLIDSSTTSASCQAPRRCTRTSRSPTASPSVDAEGELEGAPAARRPSVSPSVMMAETGREERPRVADTSVATIQATDAATADLDDRARGERERSIRARTESRERSRRPRGARRDVARAHGAPAHRPARWSQVGPRSRH